MQLNFPHFIQDKLVHFCSLNISRNQRTSLALLRNLKFYEVHQKSRQIINSIDLQNSILRKIQYKFDTIELEINETKSQASDPCTNVDDITFGKYIFQNQNYKMVYILLKCWNSMVVIKRDIEGFILHAEYENVLSFGVSKGSHYKTSIKICFLHNDRNDEITNFQRSQHSSVAVLPTTDVYRKIMEKIKMQKSELLVHQTITRKEFAKLKSTELFGCNILRTPRLEELQIISKCGNAWVKLTANDDVVVGVPIVNNCSSRLTVLRNFRAVIQGIGDLTISFKLYQLNKSFGDSESILSFLNDSESDDKYSPNCTWRQCLDFYLRPEAYCLLVLKLNMNEHFFESGLSNVPLFVFYDVNKYHRTFNQKCFITTIPLQGIFLNQANRLNFNESHLHRDLLTVIASSFETEVRLEYDVSMSTFEDYFCSKLGFLNCSRNQCCSQPMNVDGQDDDINDATIKEKLILFNKNPNSFWHGTLLEVVHSNVSSSNMRIFTKSMEKSKLLLKLLGNDLKAICGIKQIRRDTRILSAKVIDFEAALREECSSFLEACSDSTSSKVDKDPNISLHIRLHLNELKTDLLFKHLEL